jgi:hypothetical protein
MISVFLKSLLRRLPLQMQGGLLYLFRTYTRASWGGPFNGQPHRQRMVRETLVALKPDFILETGTYRGTSTEFLAKQSKAKIFSFEFSRREYGYSKVRMARFMHVRVTLADSRTGLKSFFAQHNVAAASLFCDLDAHWNDDLPLRDELSLVFSNAPDAVVMVDDFCVIGDSGYGFDDYGEGKSLVPHYLADSHNRFHLKGFCPSASSSEDAGARRGCIVLCASERTQQMLAALGSLRAIEAFDDFVKR